MEEHGDTPTVSHKILYLVDNRPLRRAQLLSFLRKFTEDHDLRILQFTVPEQLSESQTLGGGLCILNAGGRSMESEFFLRLQALCQVDPSRRVVVFSDVSDVQFVKASFQAGCRGVIPTSTHPDIAQHALLFVLRGGTYIPPSALDDEGDRHVPSLRQERPHSKLAPPERQPLTHSDGNATTQNGDNAKRDSPVNVLANIASLTPKQSIVLDHLRKARSNKEIARYLDMSEATVKLHIRQIMRKLGAKNRTDAALIAAQLEANFDPHGHHESLEPCQPGFSQAVISADDVKGGNEVIWSIPDHHHRPPLKMVQGSHQSSHRTSLAR